MIRFHISSIPVTVHPFFFLTAFLIGPRSGALAVSVVWVAVVFVGILLHEIGHAVAGRAMGLAPAISLHGFGGLTSWRGGASLSHGRQILISAAGPAVGIAIGGAALIIGRALPLQTQTLCAHLVLDLVWVNLGWGLLNLLPVLPLDGGNIAASAAEMLFGLRGRQVARIVSLGLTILLTGWAVVSMQVWLAILGGILTMINWKAMQSAGGLPRRRPRPSRPDPEIAGLTLAADRGDWPAVVDEAQRKLEQTDDPAVAVHALHMLAWGRLALGDVAGARSAVDAMTPHSEPDPALLGTLRLEEGAADEALGLLEKALAEETDELGEARWLRAVTVSGRFGEAAAFVLSTGGGGLSASIIAKTMEAAAEREVGAAVNAFATALGRRPADAETAFAAARSLSRVGSEDEALQWMSRAVAAGFHDVGRFDTDPWIEAVRSHEAGTALRSRIMSMS